MIRFFIPIMTLGLMSMIFPYVYAFLPVHESELCVCSFYHQIWKREHGEGGRTFLLLNSSADYEVLQTINSASFYIVNWLALVAIVAMVYAIRHVMDETLIKRECVLLVFIWVMFSIIQFSMFFWGQISDCFQDNPITSVIESTYKVTYWAIILRDASVLSTTMYFQLKVSRQSLYYSRLIDADANEAKEALADFEILLISVIPHRAFKRFLAEEHPEMLPYLQMVHLCKLYQDDQESLDQAMQD